MAGQPSYLRNFLSAGHAPTLGTAFFYFAFSCCIWVMNGAMAPIISGTHHLTPAQKRRDVVDSDFCDDSRGGRSGRRLGAQAMGLSQTYTGTYL